MTKKLIFALIILMMAISAASAGDTNITDTPDLATDKTSDDLLSTDDDFDNDDDDDDDDDENYGWDDDYIIAKLEIVDYPKKYGDNQVHFRLTNTADNSTLANIDLAVEAYTVDNKLSSGDVLGADSTSGALKMGGGGLYEYAKITTNASGIAVFTIPEKFTGNFHISAGLYEDGCYMTSAIETEYNGTEVEIALDDFLEEDIIQPDITGTLKLSKEGSTFGDVVLKVTLISTLNRPISNEKVEIKFSNGKKATVTTNSKGVATYNVPFAAGTYSATAKAVSERIHANTASLNSFSISKAPVTINPTKLSTTYASGKYFTVKVTNSKTKKAMSGAKLSLKIYTKGRAKTVTVTTNSKGIAKYQVTSLSIGAHKVIASLKDAKSLNGKAKASSIIVKKASYTISAPKTTTVYKHGSFQVTVKNKVSKKRVKNVKVTVKIYTGTKYKLMSAKTNSRGVVTFSTKALTKGTHKVIVSADRNANYKAGSAKSSITVVKSKIATRLADEGKPSELAAFSPFISSNFQIYMQDGHQVGYAAKITLRDANGRELHKTISVYMDGTFIASGTSGKFFFVPKTGLGTMTFRFAGDSTYKASSFSKDISIILA